MSFLKTLGNLAKGATSIGSLASGVGSLIGLGKGVAGLFGSNDDTKKQIKMQKELMDYQNDINRSNSLLDYQRQRQLTIDNASLQKQGLRQAGQNTSLGDGSIASAANVGGTAPVSSPSPLPTQSSIDAQYAQMMSQSMDTSLKAAQIANLNAQTAKTKTEAERARFEFDNYRKNQVDNLNKLLLNQWRQSYYKTLVDEQDTTKKLKEADFWNSDGGKRIEQAEQAKLDAVVTNANQIQFDFEQAKKFKPKEFELLEKQIQKLVEDIAFQKSNTDHQDIINKFNRLGIGITSDFVGSIASLLTSGHGKELAQTAVSTIADFLKGLVGQVKTSLF